MTKDEFSIGELAAATGISTHTIRAWERRYGRPKPMRRPSGHRRYTAEVLVWLRRVAEALSFGHRAGTVVRARDVELEELLRREAPAADPQVDHMLAMAAAYRERELVFALSDGWRELGPRAFLRRRIDPLLRHAGRRWADGDIRVCQEHFLSNVVHDQLVAFRCRMPRMDAPADILLTTLPGERHGIGIQMIAITCALLGQPPIVLGTETPVEEIAAAARDTGVQTIGVSVSLATAGTETDNELRKLRRCIPDRTVIVVGGAGARRIGHGPRGVVFCRTLDEFEDRYPAVAV